MDEMTVPASVVAALVARVEQLEVEVRELRGGGQSTSGPSTAVS